MFDGHKFQSHSCIGGLWHVRRLWPFFLHLEQVTSFLPRSSVLILFFLGLPTCLFPWGGSICKPVCTSHWFISLVPCISHSVLLRGNPLLTEVIWIETSLLKRRYNMWPRSSKQFPPTKSRRMVVQVNNVHILIGVDLDFNWTGCTNTHSTSMFTIFTQNRFSKTS